MRDAATGRREAAGAVWALALLAALPALVLAVASLGEGWQTAADHAPIELRVRDVGGAHTPLVGPYSRYGWNHPGPSLFYALAPAYRVVGSADGLLVGAALVNAAAAGVAVVIAGRRGGTALAALLAGGVLAMSLAMGTELLRDPWNPWIAVLPFLTCVVAAWAVTTGSTRSIPVAVAAGSFSAQAHVGYLPLVAACGLVVAAAIVAHHGWRPPWRPWVLAGVAVGVALWLPVAVEQVTGDPGNLTELADQAGDPAEDPPGFDGVRSYLLPHLGPWPAWYEPTWLDPLGTGFRRPGLPIPPVGLAAFVAGTALVVWRRCRRPLLLAGVVTATWAAGALAASQVTGIGPYLTRWSWVLGLLLWLSASWSLWSAGLDVVAARHGPAPDRARRPAIAVALVAVATLSLLAVVDVPGAPLPIGDDDGIGEVARQAAEAARAEVPPGSTVELRGLGPVVFDLPALVVALERAGLRPQLDPAEAHVFGDHRTGRDEPDLVVVLRSDDEVVDGPTVVEGVAELTQVATVDQLSPAERREWPAVDAARPACEAAAYDAFFGIRPDLDDATRARCARRAALAPRAKVLSVFLGRPAG